MISDLFVQETSIAFMGVGALRVLIINSAAMVPTSVRITTHSTILSPSLGAAIGKSIPTRSTGVMITIDFLNVYFLLW